MSPPAAFDATRGDIAFVSSGKNRAGWLYRPATDATVPLIVMAHGFSGVKEQGLAEFAEGFRAAGFAVLVFGFRHFGASDGAPRGQLFPLDMVEDYRCAISWPARATAAARRFPVKAVARTLGVARSSLEPKPAPAIRRAGRLRRRTRCSRGSRRVECRRELTRGCHEDLTRVFEIGVFGFRQVGCGFLSRCAWVAELFLKRKLSLPVSRMWQW